MASNNLADYIISLPLILLAGYLFLRYFYFKQSEKEPASKVILVTILGGISVAIALYAEQFFARYIGIANLGPDQLPYSEVVSKMVIMLLFVGFIEELSKFLAAMPIFFSKDFNRIRDGIFYMALAGLGFGLVEDFIYVGRVGAGGVILRLAFGLLFHPAASGFIGYYLGRAKYGLSSMSAVFAALVRSMLLHGLYDIGLVLQIPILAAFSTAIALLLYGYIFILYNNSEKQDRELGLETSSVYLFCPRCGFPNAHKDFCVKCGKKLLKDKVNV